MSADAARWPEPEPIRPIRMPRPATLVGIALLLALSPLACSEAMYRYGLTTVERPALPSQTVPALVAEAAWVLAGHSGPRQLRSGAPWNSGWFIVPFATQGDRLGLRAQPDHLAARLLVLGARPRPTSRFRQRLASDSLATWLRRNATADQAITLWLSHEYFGHGVPGLDLAAAKLVGKPVARLDAEEVARLLALTQYPGTETRPALWKERRDQILAGLLLRGTISAEAAAEARSRPLPPAK